jgi:hypothetical protein
MCLWRKKYLITSHPKLIETKTIAGVHFTGKPSRRKSNLKKRVKIPHHQMILCRLYIQLFILDDVILIVDSSRVNASFKSC